MKTAIVKLGDITIGTGCMSALRFTDSCHECKIVMRCPNKEAHLGRLRKLRERRAELRRQLGDIHRQIMEELDVQSIQDADRK